MRLSLATVVLIGVGVTALVVFSSPASRGAAAQVRPDSNEAYDAIIDEEVGDARRSEIQKRLKTRKPQGQPPRTVWDGKPDFNGVFYPYVDIEPEPVKLDALYRPEPNALRKRMHEEITPNMHCYPNTFNASFERPHPLEIFHGPGVLVAITEVFGVARIIPIVDGPLKHNPSAVPSFQGDSVAHWEGDTLVVDVTKFNGKGWLLQRQRTVISDQLHIVERWTRPDSETVEYQAVAEDPKMLTGPWTSPKMRRGKLNHDFSSFDPCLDDTNEMASTIEALNATPEQVKLSQDVLLYGGTKILEREAGKK